MKFDINHGAAREYVRDFIFPGRTDAWIDADVPCHPLDIGRHRVSKGHVRGSFHDITARLEREFHALNGPRNPTPAEARELIRDAFADMHATYSEIDGFDYGKFGQIVDQWLVSQGCP